ncbi:hypothetical protein HDU67_000043 [Dinochytrium kinnereticum]|nr:hypothetical protein HDU67_000043 [Dinochytrium kinnereticum]
MVSKRLMKELREVERDPSDQILDLRPASDDDLFVWRATLMGTIGSAYEDGRFDLEIHIPQNYPIHPPTIRFKTKICHPNVHWKTPEPDSPLNCDAANLLRCGDHRGYNSLVKMYTRMFAVKQ